MKILIILLLVTSCSLFEESREYKPYKKVDTPLPVPSYTVWKNTITQKNRGPASFVAKKRIKRDVLFQKELQNYSNKKIYFLSLMNQYLKLNLFLEAKTPKIKICPQFHNEILKHQLYQSQDHLFNTTLPILSQYTKNTSPTRLPELNLIIHPESSSISLNEYINSGKSYKQGLTEALGHYTKNLYYEINELCQTGNSESYYLFTNYVEYVTNKKFISTGMSATSLFKINIIPNMILLTAILRNYPKEFSPNILNTPKKSTPSRQIASTSDQHNLWQTPILSIFEKEGLYRTNALWAINYVKSLTSN